MSITTLYLAFHAEKYQAESIQNKPTDLSSQ